MSTPTLSPSEPTVRGAAPLSPGPSGIGDRRRRLGGSRASVVAPLLALMVAAGACTGEDAVPIEDLPLQDPDVTHFLEPTDQMLQLAEEQCRADPDLAQGVIEAVDPDDPDVILSSITIDCDEVR